MNQLAALLGPDEAEMLRHQSQGRRHVLEFGCGGSTVLFLENGVGRVDSVESDRSWIKQVANNTIAREAISSGRLRLHYTRIGTTGKWGFPIDDSSKDYWPRYSRSIWRVLEPSSVDFVFIDGRFRVACALIALSHVGTPGLIAVHDFWPRLKAYGEILEFLDVVARTSTLGIFSPRPDVNGKRLKRLVREYSMVPA